MPKRISRRSKQTLPPLLSLMTPPPVAPEITRPPKRAKQQNAGGIDPEHVPVVLHLRRLAPERLAAALRWLTPTQRLLVEHVVLSGRPLVGWCRKQKSRGIVSNRQVERGKLLAALDLLTKQLGCGSGSDLAA